MAYRNKTYVAFASEDIHCYRMMEAWRDNVNIDFDFFDAHDLCVALDTSQPSTIRRRLRERLINTKQTVILVSNTTRGKGGRSSSFLYYEIETIAQLGLPVVFANLDGNRKVASTKLPVTLQAIYSISVSFQPTIIKYALDNYVPNFQKKPTSEQTQLGPHFYNADRYKALGL